MRALTLVVAGPRPPANDVEEVLASWLRAGLLQPTLWVERDAAKAVEGAGALVAWRLGEGRETPVSIIDELARHDLRTVRLLAAHLAVDREADPSLLGAADDLASTLQDFLAPTQRLERLNVLIPASGVTQLDPRLVGDPAIKHLVVSPEDRVSDRHASRQLLWPDGGYSGHAALAIATIAGLWWATGDDAPFDREHFTSSAERAQTVVTRSFARVLRAGKLGDRVTAEVFERRRTEAWTAAAVDAADAPNPEQLISELADQIGQVEGQAISYRPAQPLATPPRRTVGVLEAFSMMLRFIVGKLRGAPSQIAGRVAEGVRRAVEGFAQNVTFGRDSLVEVGFGGRSSDAPMSRMPRLLAADHAAQLLRDLGRSASPPATASLWHVLRRVSFGLIDAGPFPEEVDPPTDGARRLVVGDGTFVVADPEDRFELNRTTLGAMHPLPAWALEPIPAWDVARLKDLRQLLSEEQQLAERGGQRESALSDDDAEIEPDPELAQRLASLLVDLERYAQRHGTSLLWRLSDQLASALKQASTSFLSALKRVREGAPSEDDNKMKLAARWLRRRWILLLVLALLIPAAAWYASERGWWDPLWTPVIVVAALVWLVGWFVSFISYQRRVFQIQYEHDRRHHEYLNAIVRAEHDAGETVRLASLYDQYLDWAAVIAWMVHHPEGRFARVEDDQLPNPEQAPLALRVAEGEPSVETLRRTSAVIGRGVFSRGWLGGLFGEYARGSIEALKHELGLPPDAPDPDPDRDLAGSPPPRRFIRNQVETGSHAARWHERVRSQVDAALADVPPGDLFERVRGTTDEDQIPDIPAAEFLADVIPVASDEHRTLMHQTWKTEAQFDRPAKVARSVVWTPSKLTSPSGNGIDTRTSIPADGGMAGTFVLAAIRCDVTEGSPVSDFDIFQGERVSGNGPDTGYSPEGPG
jgi:hypothetical protein